MSRDISMTEFRGVHATKRKRFTGNRNADVDSDHCSACFADNSLRERPTTREYAARISVFDAIFDLHRVRNILAPNDSENGAKQFVACGFGTWSDQIENGRA